MAVTTDADVAFDALDARALTTPMTVLEDVGRAAGAPDLYEVVTEHQYLVDLRGVPACECDDHRYRDRKCYHIRRVEFAIGVRKIPTWVDPADVDDQLGLHVRADPRWSR